MLIQLQYIHQLDTIKLAADPIQIMLMQTQTQTQTEANQKHGHWSQSWVSF